jgi:hypothetical protein
MLAVSCHRDTDLDVVSVKRVAAERGVGEVGRALKDGRARVFTAERLPRLLGHQHLPPLFKVDAVL